ncbi:MAG TPA: hypothetical protein VGH49_02655 [Xanthobacteraceae bacterium]
MISFSMGAPVGFLSAGCLAGGLQKMGDELGGRLQQLVLPDQGLERVAAQPDRADRAAGGIEYRDRHAIRTGHVLGPLLTAERSASPSVSRREAGGDFGRGMLSTMRTI